MSGRPTSHKSCCIPKCRLNTKQTGDEHDEDDEIQVSYHTFPFDETESLVWLKNICAADKSHIELFPNSRVCSRHFTEDDYVPNLPHGRIRLKVGAVPTVFDWTTVNSNETAATMDVGLPGEDGNHGNTAGFTVHVARKKPGADNSSETDESAAATIAIPSHLSPPQTTGLDLSSTNKAAFIALQSPPSGLAISTSRPNSIPNSLVAMEEDDVDDDDDASKSAVGAVAMSQDQCVNCEILETELSRASIELTNLQREKVLLHAKCAELEDEVQKIHVYCKQLKALNDHLQLVTAKDKEEKAQRLKEASMKASMQQEQLSQTTQSSPHHHQIASTAPAHMVAALFGKGRRKQSNPMKRPRDNETNSQLSNGDLNPSQQPPDGTPTEDAASSEQPAKIPALDNNAATSNNHNQDHPRMCKHCSSIDSTDASTQTTIEGANISGMKDENDLLSGVLTDERRLHRTLFVKSILTTNENVKTFTGIPTKEGLEVLFEVLMDAEMMNLHWQSRPGDTMMAAQKKAYLSVNRRGMSSPSPFHDFLITLIRLNLGLKHVVLSSLFGCSTAKTSTVCRSWIEYMRGVRENTMIGKLLAHLPLDVQKSERVEQHMISLPPLVSESQWIGICRSFLDRHKNNGKMEAAAAPTQPAAVATPKLSPSTSLGIKVKETKAGAGIVLENYHSHIKRETRKGSNAGLPLPLPPIAIKQEPGVQGGLIDPTSLLSPTLAGAQANGMMYLLSNGCVVQDYSKLALSMPQFPQQLLPMTTTMASIPPSLQALAQVGTTTTPTIDLSEATSGKTADILQQKTAGTASAEDLAKAFGIESMSGLIAAAKSEPQA